MSLRFNAGAAVAVALSCAAATPAFAHVVLEVREAPAGSYYKATFRVGHGCKGSPTTQIKVTLPEGVNTAKPQPKPGWTFAAVKAPVQIDPHAAHAGHADHGPAPTERTALAIWSGGPLADDQYDEFVLMLKLPDAPGTTLYFPVEQICAEGVNHWVEVPAPGQNSRDLKGPAAALKLAPKP